MGCSMDKARCGGIMEKWAYGDTKIAVILKGSSISCKKITLIHYTMSSVTMTTKKSRRKKFPKVIRSFENKLHLYKCNLISIFS